jgi:HNH endonuclease
MPTPEVAHIFPLSMLNKPTRGEGSKASRYIPDFWELVQIFWDEDRIIKWKSKILPDPQNPDTGVEACSNLISLAPHAHDMWVRGLFALKPLAISTDRRELAVQFFWQPQGKYKSDDRINLLAEPTSSEGVNLVGDGYFLHRVENENDQRICSGDIFTLTTDDPNKRPLPSMELLDMQWFLQRLMGMCGSAAWPSLEMEDDDIGDYFNDF